MFVSAGNALESKPSTALRDLGKALNFYVGWSQEQGMFIETDKPYSE